METLTQIYITLIQHCKPLNMFTPYSLNGTKTSPIQSTFTDTNSTSSTTNTVNHNASIRYLTLRDTTFKQAIELCDKWDW
jgi:hypothetical protein